MIEKAILVPRPKATKKVVSKRDMDRVSFSVSYKPTLPSIPLIIAKAQSAMVTSASDPRLAEVFKKPPMVAYRRPLSITDKLDRREWRSVKLRHLWIFQKGKVVKANQSSTMATMDCQTSNVMNYISCTKMRYRLQYVGKTVSE